MIEGHQSVRAIGKLADMFAQDCATIAAADLPEWLTQGAGT